MNQNDIIKKSNVRILVVEDSRTQAEQLKYILELEEYQVLTAENGEKALDLITAHKPTIVISDIIMPGINGYELCRKIKTDKNLRGIPVILLTSLSEPIDVIRGLECGADNFIIKPYEEKILLNRLQHVLSNWNLRDQDKSQLIIEINFLGEKYQISSDRLQILNLLLTTYETAVQKNKDLLQVQFELKVLNESLENKVKQRTEELINEINRRKKMEEELEKTNEELELRVAARTIELEKVNEKIKHELIEKENAERTLLLSEEKFSKAFHSSPNLMAIYDLNIGSLLEVNESLLFYTNYDRNEIISQKISNLHIFDSKIIENINEILKQKGKIGNMEINYWIKSGKYNIGLLSAEIIEIGDKKCVLIIINDITERRKLEEELQKNQKLESLGILAGGIAHDFNNMLSAILGRVSLIMDDVPDGDIKKNLINIEKATLRAVSLTQQLLTFARGGSPEKHIIALEKTIRDTVKFALSGSNIDAEFDFMETSEIEADPSQIAQVIQNLTINAKQSMPKGGKIKISAENCMDKSANHYVRIKITDNGIGIPKENLDKIFDPYFTTRQTGIGLGLSVCHSIITKHGGQISAESEVGRGSTITILLPITIKGLSHPAEKKDFATKKLNILIMDDDIEIRDLLTSMLNKLGHSVSITKEGGEAIRKYKDVKEHGESFDLVFMDLTVKGGMGGKEAIKILRKYDPDSKVIVSSGYADSAIASYIEDGFDGMLKKPYSLNDLNEVIHEVIVK